MFHRSALHQVDYMAQDQPPIEEHLKRKGVFLVPRPPYEHIKAPLGPNLAGSGEPSFAVPTGHYKTLQRETIAGKDFGCENSKPLKSPDRISTHQK